LPFGGEMKTCLIAVCTLLGAFCSSPQLVVSQISSSNLPHVVGISSNHTYPPPHLVLFPDILRAGIPPKQFSVVSLEDIKRLCMVAIERGERPSPEGHLILEFRSGGFRQYVTLTLALGLFGGFVAIARIDFIQEQWQVNVLDQDEIDQWVIAANSNGTAHNVWHRRLLEDNGAVLKEEFQPTDEDGARAIVEKIVARFLTPNLNAVCNSPCSWLRIVHRWPTARRPLPE
jgi:hypothetical protein